MPSARVDADALVGKTLCGKYRVLQLLGSGGVGHVVLAERLGRAKDRVAVKLLRAEHRDNPTVVARFEREAEAASRVHHPNVLRVELLERGAGVPCFAMELLVGLDLADTLASARVLAPPRAARIAADVAAGLEAAHRAGVIHRDVKPENVFLVHAPDGREIVKVLDFGLSFLRGHDPEPRAAGGRALSHPQLVGTLEYVAPEQARGAPPSPEADVYALGIVLYEMLAGRAPFVGRAPSIVEKHLREPPPPLHRFHPGLLISRDLDAVVRKALVKDPRARFASMAELRDALVATPEGRTDVVQASGAGGLDPPRSGGPAGPGSPDSTARGSHGAEPWEIKP
jgi:serine/threonine-protein kinase